MSLPSDMVVLLDVSKPASFTSNGVTAGDRGLVDTRGILTQSTLANQPTYCRYNMGAGPGLIFGGNGAPKFAQPTWLNMSSFTFQIPFSLTIAMRGDGVATATELSSNVSSARGVLVGTDTSAIKINGPSGIATFTAAAGWNSSNVAQVITLTCNGTKASTVLLANGVAVTLTPSGADPGTGTATITGTVGQDHAGATPLTGAISFLGFIPGRIQTGAETTAIQAYCAATNCFPPAGSVTRNPIGCGDSLIVGFQTVASGAAAFGFYQRALSILGPRFGVTPNNNGVGGALLTTGSSPANVQLQWTGTGAGQIVSGKTNVVAIDGGLNDISSANPLSISAANTIGFTTGASMATVVQAVASSLSATSGGPHYILLSTIALGQTNGFQQIARKLANDIIRDNYRSWGNANAIPVLVDIGADAAISGHSSVNTQLVPYYYAGEPIHLAKPGQERWAALFARAALVAGL
jgi:hypothetical protein